ncbi:MAG: UTP--glucose-1-phosphate uridylyltransferase [Bifidobacteriaceae bacterium]|jgi:UTP--glucose-1-phosphate uridylyltransferase|nr:UTP--glucose-1-phosphate uridylyltransferase [Bifidobacteriaceae bacterium]
MTITKAVIPAAGLGTRFLPATKSVPKELLPVVDTPAIEYVVREASAAGLHNVLLITGKTKGAILDHFDRSWDLETVLEEKGDFQRLRAIQESAGLAKIHAVRQSAPQGLGHAVYCAKEHIGRDPFAVLLGDDLIDARDPLLSSMIAVHEEFGGSVVALMRVPRDQISLYGSAAAQPVASAVLPDGVFRLSELVEKPRPTEAPSDLAIIGRYVLDPAVFEVLERTPPGRGGEIQLTDALAELAEMPPGEGGGLYGVLFNGRRYDTGDRLDYLKAVVQLAAGHPELGEDFSDWLTGFTEQLERPAASASVR